jgi:Arc/MetJ family transcription regulator
VTPPDDRPTSGPGPYTILTRLVYDRCMARSRTNIEIEDDYVEAIMNRFGVHTKTEAVDLALRHLAGQPMTREEALAMHGAHAIDHIPPDVAPTGAS